MSTPARPASAFEFDLTWVGGTLDRQTEDAVRLALGLRGRSPAADAFLRDLPFELGALATGSLREGAAMRDQAADLARAAQALRRQLERPSGRLRSILHAFYRERWYFAEDRPAASALPEALADLDALLVLVGDAAQQAADALALERGIKHSDVDAHARRAGVARLFARHFPGLSTTNKRGPFALVIGALRERGLLE